MKSIIITVISLIFVSWALEHRVVSASASTLSNSRFLRSLAKAENSDDERANIEAVDIVHNSFLMKDRFTERPLKQVLDELNKHNEALSGEHVSLYKYLQSRYKDEQLFQGVSKSLRNADHVTTSIRSKVRDDQIADMVERKVDPVSVIQYVWPRGDDGVDLIDKGSLYSWLLYLRAYSKKDVDVFKTTIETMLNWRDGRANVVQLIYRIEKLGESDAEELVKNLKEPLLQKWKDDHMTNEQVFNELNIGDNNPRRNAPFVNIWLSYVEKNNDDDGYVELVKQLKPPAFYQVVLATTRFSRLHNKLPQSVFKRGIFLLTGKESPENLFFIFGLDYDKNTLLSNPFFKEWRMYSRLLKPMGDKDRLLEMLQDYFGYSDLAEIIVKGQENPHTVKLANMMKHVWLSTKLRTKKGPANFFKQLDFNDIGDYANLLVDPKFKLWHSYAENFNKKYPSTTAIKDLLLVMVMEDVVQVLETGLEHSESLELAKTLEKQLFNVWQNENYQVSKLDNKSKGIVIRNYKEFLQIKRW